MCKCVLQRQPSEGSWEHPSQPINTLKDPAGSREEGNRTWFPLEALGGESRDPRSVFHRTCWDGSYTQKACLQGAASQGARLAMGQNGCSPLWPSEDVGYRYPHRGNPIMAVSEEDSRGNGSAEIPESFKKKVPASAHYLYTEPSQKQTPKSTCSWMKGLSSGHRFTLSLLKKGNLRGTVVGCCGNRHTSPDFNFPSPW